MLQKLSKIVPKLVLNVFTMAIGQKMYTFRKNSKIKENEEIRRKYRPIIILKYANEMSIFQHFSDFAKSIDLLANRHGESV